MTPQRRALAQLAVGVVLCILAVEAPQPLATVLIVVGFALILRA